MFFKRMLIKIDSLLCSYIGINKSYSKPEKVELISNNLFITNTDSHKRHLSKISFTDIKLSEYTKEDKEKLGKAIGKSLATNLVIRLE